ncbi:hypothetical protein PMAYCL1PPCAC_26591, partial [Pristionchus mayeri]
IPATSEPAIGSVTAYASMTGASVSPVRNRFLMSSFQCKKDHDGSKIFSDEHIGDHVELETSLSSRDISVHETGGVRLLDHLPG